jgi:hypothetical protein
MSYIISNITYIFSRVDKNVDNHILLNTFLFTKKGRLIQAACFEVFSPVLSRFSPDPIPHSRISDSDTGPVVLGCADTTRDHSVDR